MTFDEWLNEIENYSLRVERMYDDLDMMTGVPKTASEARRNQIVFMGWLRAAYNVGYEQGRNDYI